MEIKTHYPAIAVSLFLIFIVTAHILASNNYNFSKNTISDLGSQLYSKKLIMQIGFLVFGLTLAVGIFLNGLTWRTSPILVYALCVALTGVFCTKPFFETNLPYSELHSNLHSVFAQIAGIAFCVGILVQIIFTIEPKMKLIHLLFFLAVIGLSISFGLMKNYQGIAQRVMYLVGFIWLIRFYRI